ncbi:M23 family metallopeptidase [Harryflintia acetispora]|uniref:M23 family metallopeptidase n=1 Tax=Harryflintia acetispora TaxID=1849041 RepID=UPI001899B197|nr:M23 family metallopeptidase [Harryflintia acetispora]
MSNHSKFGKFLSSKGFYIALAVCVVGAGAAAWVAIDSTMNSITAQDEKKLQNPPAASSQADSGEAGDELDWGFSDLKEAERKVEDVEISSSSAPEEKKEETKSSTSSPAQPQQALSSEPSADVLDLFSKPAGSSEQPILAYSLPVMSEVFNPYSGGELVKNVTLNDWRTHDGIDIKAAKGTDVMACADGTVSKIYDDALWGTCVEIEHAGSLVSVYCGLDNQTLGVQEGQQVKVKDVIGKADKVPCEISLENHIHFGLKQAGKWVDPVETMGLK